MAFNDTSKQIRARITAQEESLLRPRRTKKQAPRVDSPEWREAKLTDLSDRCKREVEKGDAHWAGQLAMAVVHYALMERAAEIQRDLRRVLWKARIIARHEFYSCESI